MKNLLIKSLVVLGAVFVVSAPAYATKDVLMPDGFVFAEPDNQTPEEMENMELVEAHLIHFAGTQQNKVNFCNVEAKDRKGNERKAFMSHCMWEFAKTDEDKKASIAAYPYPAAKTIWVKLKYVSDPPGAVLYIATTENRGWQSELSWEVESAKASIADATKSLSDPRWKSEKDKDAGPRFAITAEQKVLTSLNPRLKELEDSAAATGVRLGYTPFTMRYRLDVDTGVKSDEKQVFILPATLRWASGATAPATIRIDLNRIELLKAAGTHKTITVTRPDNVPGRVADEEFAFHHAGCNKESAAIEKERAALTAYALALPGWPGRVNDADENAVNEMLRKFQEHEINVEFRCVSPAAASLLEQRFHDLKVETQMKIDANNARQQPTITIQPSRPSMEELIMQQPTQPPVSNSIHCRTNSLMGTVYTDCN